MRMHLARPFATGVVLVVVCGAAFFLGRRSAEPAAQANPTAKAAPFSPPTPATLVFNSGPGVDPQNLREEIRAAIRDELRRADHESEGADHAATRPPPTPQNLEAAERATSLFESARRAGRLDEAECLQMRDAFQAMDFDAAQALSRQLIPAINRDEIRIYGNVMPL